MEDLLHIIDYLENKKGFDFFRWCELLEKNKEVNYE